MKKRIVAILVCLIFILSALSLVVTAFTVSTDQKNIFKNQDYSDEECDCDDDSLDYLFPLLMKCPTVDSEDIFNSPKPEAAYVPDEFSWTDYNGGDWSSPIRDQGNCGSCWLFAAIGIIESKINIKEECPYLDLDLSEQYVLSCIPRAGSCLGSRSERALKYIIDNSSDGNYHNGVIPESCMPYQAHDDVPCDEKCLEWEDQLIPIVSYGTWRCNPEDNEAIKAQILESGPIATDMYVTNDFVKWHSSSHDPYDYYSHPLSIYTTNHEVIIVGWKNDPSIENGGYWICKNSWGPGFGYNGFFNIEYGSLSIDSSKIVFVEYDPESYDCPPVARAGGLYEGSIGEEIIFDATNSFDAEGVIASYVWDFGDGIQHEGSRILCSFLEKGIYPVNLTVFDKNGNKGTDKSWVFVDKLNYAPDDPIIKSLTINKKGLWNNYSVLADDPELDDIYYYIDWGDGFVNEWIGPYNSGESLNLRHYWYFSGRYTIKVKAKDIYGFESDWTTLKVTVSNDRQSLDRLAFGLFSKMMDYFPFISRLLNI
jgi:C1A family cysteine protease